jgi:hypothetical protein
MPALSSLLLLLLLGVLLVLAHGDGAAWVQAALVRDLVCCTSCPTCSSVSCWAALICSACASITAWSSKAFSLACQETFSSLLPAPVTQPVQVLLVAAWLGWFPAAAAFAAEVLLSARLFKLRASR